MPEITPKQAAKEVFHVISRGLTPLLTSSPGIGKSSIVAEIATNYRLKLIDIRLSQCTPEDLNGFPMRVPVLNDAGEVVSYKASFTPFDMFPLEGEEIPEGYEGWFIFLDELTSATKPVQVAAYKLILDRMVGSHKLHENVLIAAAGNKSTDRAVVNKMSTALQSRMIHFDMKASAPEWIEHAFKRGFDHRVISYISYMPNKLMQFDPEHQDKTFACPRTWEFLSTLIQGEDVSEAILPRIAGTVGQGAAVEFITFAREFDRLPKIEEIVKDPENYMIPPEASTKFATMSMLVEHYKEDTLDALIKYVKRFEIEMQILFTRGLAIRNPDLAADHDGLRDYMRGMMRYLQ